jgi:hypothetical protein
MAKVYLLVFVIMLAGCIKDGPEDLQSPITVISVTETPRQCTAVLMGEDGTLLNQTGAYACNWTVGQKIETVAPSK